MTKEFDVEVSKVTKTFGKTNAVENIDLQVRRGEFLTLLGPSGCGKTTLLRMIAGFELPTSGKILLGGQDVTNLPPYKRNVHTVFQHYALFPHRTVSGNIAFGLEQRGMKKPIIKEKVDAALDLVQLGGFGERYPNQLSGGQQQRVAIARALILEPPVLLLDEPLGALDLKLRKEMQVELKRLQQRLGISFIFVTHDQEEALVMSDRIAVMRCGHIEQLGSAQEIYERPRTEFVADFIGVSNVLPAEVLNVDNGNAKLHICGVDTVLKTSEKLSKGAQIKIVVRPEKIHLHTKAQEHSFPNAPAIVEEKVYFGNSTHWRVRTKDEALVIVFEQNRSAEGDNAQYHSGQQVFLSWDDRNTVILEANGEK